MATTTRPPDKTRTDLIEAAIQLLADQGVEALALRRVAGAAHVSTMCVYSRFGDKIGLLDAVYAAGFERLGLTLASVEPNRDPIAQLRALALAYRRFAVANPALYSLMFERVVGYDPSPELRAEAVEPTFAPVVDTVRDAIEQGLIHAEGTLIAAYTLWTAAHGAISLELTHAAPKPMTGWVFDNRDSGEDIFRQAMDTALRGLSPAGPAVA